MKWLPLTSFLFLFCNCAEAFITSIDVSAKECFSERVEPRTKLGLTFEIVDGGFSDIDVTLVGPNGQLIHQSVQEESGKYTFTADHEGEYTYCFSNENRSAAPKLVMFTMDVEEPAKHNESEKAQDSESHASLEDMIKELSTGLLSVKNEQEYMNVRDRNHRAINESTNFRVGLWSVFEAVALICMTLGQVYYLKRFFEVRRVV